MKTSIILLCILLSSCITILKHSPDDMYLNADKSQYQSFEDYESSDSTIQKSTFSIVEIKAAQLQKEISNQEKSVVVLWATWCSHCYVEMPALIAAAKENNILFVCVNYDIKNLTKLFREHGYEKPVYVISAEEYGANENDKTVKFLNEFTGDPDSKAVFPQHFLFEKGQYSGLIKGDLPSQLDQIFFSEI
jgi:thiol-disulfide isomerase/thioredoxin